MAELTVTVGDLLEARETEVNPLLIRSDDAVTLDALVSLTG